jgi:hypothetical protein
MNAKLTRLLGQVFPWIRVRSSQLTAKLGLRASFRTDKFGIAAAVNLVLHTKFVADCRKAYVPSGRDKIFYDIISLEPYLKEAHEVFRNGVQILEVGCGYGGSPLY